MEPIITTLFVLLLPVFAPSTTELTVKGRGRLESGEVSRRGKPIAFALTGDDTDAIRIHGIAPGPFLPATPSTIGSDGIMM